MNKENEQKEEKTHSSHFLCSPQRNLRVPFFQFGRQWRELRLRRGECLSLSLSPCIVACVSCPPCSSSFFRLHGEGADKPIDCKLRCRFLPVPSGQRHGQGSRGSRLLGWCAVHSQQQTLAGLEHRQRTTWQDREAAIASPCAVEGRTQKGWSVSRTAESVHNCELHGAAAPKTLRDGWR